MNWSLTLYSVLPRAQATLNNRGSDASVSLVLLDVVVLFRRPTTACRQAPTSSARRWRGATAASGALHDSGAVIVRCFGVLISGHALLGTTRRDASRFSGCSNPVARRGRRNSVPLAVPPRRGKEGHARPAPLIFSAFPVGVLASHGGASWSDAIRGDELLLRRRTPTWSLRSMRLVEPLVDGRSSSPVGPDLSGVRRSLPLSSGPSRSAPVVAFTRSSRWAGNQVIDPPTFWSCGRARRARPPCPPTWRLTPGAVTRHVVAIGQMAIGARLIHLTGGRIETISTLRARCFPRGAHRDRTSLTVATWSASSTTSPAASSGRLPCSASRVA